MRGVYRRTPLIIASSVVALGLPLAHLASGYVGLEVAGALAANCSPVSHHLGDWWLVALLSGVILLLSAALVVSDLSTWRTIEFIRTILLSAAILWVGANGLLFVALAFVFSEHDPVPHARTWLAVPAIVPLVQALGATAAVRFTTRWATWPRLSLLAGATMGPPVLSFCIASSGLATC
ncbi:MAG: hypothetical protein J0I18_21355 [Actinobacteria bacterium]|nr:hypothetical protein [Actinomycetota bacterium]